MAPRLPCRAAFQTFSIARRRRRSYAACKPPCMRIAPDPVRQNRVNYAHFLTISRAAGDQQADFPPPRAPPPSGRNLPLSPDQIDQRIHSHTRVFRITRLSGNCHIKYCPANGVGQCQVAQGQPVRVVRHPLRGASPVPREFSFTPFPFVKTDDYF